MLKYGKFLPLVVLVGLTVGALVGCPQVVGNSMKVVNFSGTSMTTLNLRDESVGELWGPNVLPDTGILANGKGATITGIPDGIYDARAIFNSPGSGTQKVTLFQFDLPIDARGTWEWIFTTLAVGSDDIIIDALRLTE